MKSRMKSQEILDKSRHDVRCYNFLFDSSWNFGARDQLPLPLAADESARVLIFAVVSYKYYHWQSDNAG